MLKLVPDINPGRQDPYFLQIKCVPNACLNSEIKVYVSTIINQDGKLYKQQNFLHAKGSAFIAFHTVRHKKGNKQV